MTATLKSLLGEDVSGWFLELSLLFLTLEMKPEILIVVFCVKWQVPDPGAVQGCDWRGQLCVLSGR